MKDDTGQNEHKRRKKPDGDETLDELMAGYTPKQRETFLKGFRILADAPSVPTSNGRRQHLQGRAPSRGLLMRESWGTSAKDTPVV